MLKVISTHIFLKHRLHSGIWIHCANLGRKRIEIFANRRHFDYTSRVQVREIGDWFRGNPTAPWALHAPLRAEGEGESERARHRRLTWCTWKSRAASTPWTK